jgi:hypothetical protein
MTLGRPLRAPKSCIVPEPRKRPFTRETSIREKSRGVTSALQLIEFIALTSLSGLPRGLHWRIMAVSGTV